MSKLSWMTTDALHLTYTLLDDGKRKIYYWVAMLPPEHTCYDVGKPWMGSAEFDDNTQWFATESEAKLWVEAVYAIGTDMKAFGWRQSVHCPNLQLLCVGADQVAMHWVDHRPGEDKPWRAGADGRYQFFDTEIKAKTWVIDNYEAV